MEPATLTLRAYPRIHLTLVDLGGATFRTNGGVGFAIDGLPTTVVASVAAEDALSLPAAFDKQACADVAGALGRLRERVTYPPTAVSILSSVRQHVGLGTKTSMVLGALRAVTLLHRIPIKDAELQELSRRGGTSGVGIATFFCGGLIADAGQPTVSEQHYAPSGAAAPASIAIAIVKMPMPRRWRCHLILPPGVSRSGSAEVTFFRSNTPIDKSDVFQVLAAVYHGICPAVAADDFRLFRRALQAVHEVGFKRREVLGQPPVVADLLRELNSNTDLAAGMSSMGPLIHVMDASGTTQTQYLRDVCARVKGEYLGAFALRNAGFETS